MPILPTLLAASSLPLLSLGAAGLAWSAWVSARARRRIEAESPPIGSFVDTPTGRLHYVERGSGPAVVLLHGASVNLRDLSLPLLEPLAASHRVLVFDRPGYGYSTRPAGRWMNPARQARYIREGLQLLGVERPILVGHSWAASLVLAYALEFPDEVAGVVTISGATHPWPGGVALYRSLGATPWIGPLLASTLLWPLGSRMADRAVEFTLAPDPAPPAYREQAGIDLLFRPKQFVCDAQDVVGLCEFVREQSARYPELRVPLRIITGTIDKVVSPRIHSHSLHEQVPGSDLVVLEGAGHAPHHRHTRAIVDVIESLSRSAPDRERHELANRPTSVELG